MQKKDKKEIGEKKRSFRKWCKGGACAEKGSARKRSWSRQRKKKAHAGKLMTRRVERKNLKQDIESL